MYLNEFIITRNLPSPSLSLAHRRLGSALSEGSRASRNYFSPDPGKRQIPLSQIIKSRQWTLHQQYVGSHLLSQRRGRISRDEQTMEDKIILRAVFSPVLSPAADSNPNTLIQLPRNYFHDDRL
jgi:hypothetical protein